MLYVKKAMNTNHPEDYRKFLGRQYKVPAILYFIHTKLVMHVFSVQN